ncbi:hypothetical protein VP01_7g4 [Puccinia sorghi]|uniref:Uncharacterized protein n=1 Tax=Puccinia sorghi TaxID=27349 RepID=A0A0L6UAI7_9BASI|nr:hypothetical protein VP01_7g4 [Puccinia sorghi]
MRGDWASSNNNVLTIRLQDQPAILSLTPCRHIDPEPCVPPNIHILGLVQLLFSFSFVLISASLQEFLEGGFPTEPVISEPAPQLTFASSSQPLCPTGASSLIVFDLCEYDRPSDLNSGSSQIIKQFNSATESARFWTNHFPDSSAQRWMSQLPLLWPSLCQGDVVITKVKPGQDLDTVFHRTIQEIDEPRLVILSTSPQPLDSSVGRVGHEKRGLLVEGLLMENSSMPASSAKLPATKTGVFWRYTFLSDYLIVGVLVMVLLFIPPVVLGSLALQSIESPKGLKSKMVGQVTEVKGN